MARYKGHGGRRHGRTPRLPGELSDKRLTELKQGASANIGREVTKPKKEEKPPRKLWELNPSSVPVVFVRDGEESVRNCPVAFIVEKWKTDQGVMVRALGVDGKRYTFLEHVGRDFEQTPAGIRFSTVSVRFRDLRDADAIIIPCGGMKADNIQPYVGTLADYHAPQPLPARSLSA